jgi:Fe-Mn family superoxide dismutase
MTSRREFMEGAVVAGGLAFAAAGAAQAQGRTRYADKLTDASGKYEAAPLPYKYDALEPVIDARTVELHYTNHHKPACTAANRAEEELAKARESGQFGLVKHYEKELAYQLSSHLLHSIYWTNLGGKGGSPGGDLAKAINTAFGSYERCRAQLAAVSAAVEASGWGLLGYHPATKKLMILQVENHQKQTAWGIVPLLMVDVFEHAYYLKYQNRRGDYVNGLFSVVNWDNVAQRYEAALL